MSKELNIPYFVKDTLKSAICTSIPIESRDESKRFSVATFDAILYITERLMETGYPFIIEGNFETGVGYKINEAHLLKTLIEKYDYQSLTFVLHGDTRKLYERFYDREKQPERGQANQIHSELSYEDFDNWIKPLGDFAVGAKTIKIDTTDFKLVDFESHIKISHSFILCSL